MYRMIALIKVIFIYIIYTYTYIIMYIYIVCMCVEVLGILECEIYPPSKLQVHSTILWTIILILKSESQNLNLFVCIFLRQSPRLNSHETNR